MAPGIALERRAPVACASVENFMSDRRQRAHRSSLERARTHINNNWSRREEDKLISSRQNAKRDQILGERHDAVQRENIRLLLRMKAIDERRGCDTRAPSSTALAPPVLMPRSSSAAPARRGSNAPARLQELRRIDAENKKLLKRIGKAKPSISMSRMEEAHQEQRKVMQMRCQVPSGMTPRAMSRANSVGLLPPLEGRPRPVQQRGMEEELDELRAEVQTQADMNLAMEARACALEGEDEPKLADELEEGTAVDCGGVEEESTFQQEEDEQCEVQNEDERTSPYGLIIPNISKTLTDKLLEDDEQERKAAAGIAASKEAAEQALLSAAAVDSAGGQEFYGYDQVVRRYSEIQARLGIASIIP